MGAGGGKEEEMADREFRRRIAEATWPIVLAESLKTKVNPDDYLAVRDQMVKKVWELTDAVVEGEDAPASAMDQIRSWQDPEQAIRDWSNCTDVSVTPEGVWVAGPCVGHWLSDGELAELIAWAMYER